MEKKKILDEISQLIQDIDKCTGKYIKVKRNPTADMSDLVEFWNTIEQMSRLMVEAHQELSFLYDYIKDEENGNTKYNGVTDCKAKKDAKWPAW